jgi:hypothetical protein
MTQGRPHATRFVIELASKNGTDPIRSLRRGLKYLGRACGLRTVRVEELRADDRSLVAKVAKVKRGLV